MPSTRRNLAAAASLVALFGATGPFSGAAAAESETGEKLATLEDFAAQEYEAWEPGSAAGLCREWPKMTKADYNVIVLAVAVMERDHHANAAAAAEAPQDAMFDFVSVLQDAAERYQGLADMLHAAHVRVLAGMARNLSEKPA